MNIQLTNPKTYSIGGKSCTTSSTSMTSPKTNLVGISSLLTNTKMHSVGGKSCTNSLLNSPKPHSVHSKSCATSSFASPKPIQLVVNLVQLLH